MLFALSDGPLLLKFFWLMNAVMMLTEGDFLENVDWKSADLLFINGSCYGDEILENIMKLSSKFANSL